jgi:hypothetical protein
MTGHLLAAKKRVDEALEALRIGLTPYVSQRMEGAFGNKWRSHASRPAGNEDDFALDTYALLKTVLDKWREVFNAEAKMRKARAYISVALDARNKMSHFAGTIEQREALRYLDAILEVLRAIGATLQEEIVLELYTEQQSGIAPLVHVAGQPNTGQKSGAIPPPQVSIQPPVTAPKINAPVASSQTQADRIRQFACDHYVAPARRDGLTEIAIRAGDVHRDMGLRNALPAVCSAIGSNRFEQLANVILVGQTGPANGSNVYFRFTLDAQPPKALPTAVTPRPLPETNALDLDGTLVLISCVKSKLPHRAPARLLYTSAWFTGVRDIVEASGARWFVLSSRWGLVAPDEEIAPYDYTLNSLGFAERQAWANKVLERLLPVAAGFRRIVMFAGVRYREFLIGPIGRCGIAVDIPMENLRRGEQLAWLRAHLNGVRSSHPVGSHSKAKAGDARK